MREERSQKVISLLAVALLRIAALYLGLIVVWRVSYSLLEKACSAKDMFHIIQK